MRECSLCATPIPPKEDRSVVSMTVKYYENYHRDIGDPTWRRSQVFCPECTLDYSEWMKGRLDEREKVDE